MKNSNGTRTFPSTEPEEVLPAVGEENTLAVQVNHRDVHTSSTPESSREPGRVQDLSSTFLIGPYDELPCGGLML